jgi:homocysteine S-methyltransferase
VETFICEVSALDVEVIGFNCSTGPADMLNLLEKAVALTSKPLSCQPNAGMPKMMDGRYFYLASSEYMAEYAKRFIQTGARVVGGCCGTGPKHIKAMRAAIRALFPGQRMAAIKESGGVCLTTAPEMAMEKKSRLGERLKQGKFVTTVEITPPRSADPEPTIQKSAYLHKLGVHGHAY